MTTEYIPEFKFAVAEGLDDSFLPVQGDSHATGWDVRAAEDIELRPSEPAKIRLGIRCFAPEGYWLELRPRSSTFAKLNLHALYGVIDESYAGELLFACQWNPSFWDNVNQKLGVSFKTINHDLAAMFKRKLVIEKGDRIGQLVPVRRQEMKVTKITNEEFTMLCNQRGLERGDGGFGSTGTK